MLKTELGRLYAERALSGCRNSSIVVPDIAYLVGLSESIVLQTIDELCYVNEINGKQDCIIDSDWWVYLTYADVLENLPFFKTSYKVKSLITRLTKSGFLLVKDNPTKSKAKWYRVNHVKLTCALLNLPNDADVQLIEF